MTDSNKSTFRSMTSAFNNDNDLYTRWENLTTKPDGYLKLQLDLEKLNKMSPDARKKLKNAIIEKERTNRVEATKAAADKVVTDTKSTGMNVAELGAGTHTLVFIGAGSGGSSTDFNQNMTMKNNLYYAGIKEGDASKFTTSHSIPQEAIV